MNRVTTKDLENLVERINQALGAPDQPYARIDGQLIPQAGCVYLSSAYGGYSFEQMCEGGGCTDLFGYGHRWTKRELAQAARVWLEGFQAGQRKGINND